jgi:hypothetical protein
MIIEGRSLFDDVRRDPPGGRVTQKPTHRAGHPAVLKEYRDRKKAEHEGKQ